MRDLTQHLTTRADDNHAPPVSMSRRTSRISALCIGCQDLVRFFALLRIKPHAPPLVRVPVNSFEFHSCERTPQVDNLSLSLSHRLCIADNELSSFTAWTTRVSNPVCSPRFRASTSVIVQQAAFATGVPPNIYAFHRYTRNSTFLSDTPASQFPSHHGVKPRTFKRDLGSRLRALYAQ